jgi:nucleoside-diphosphate-sugar epimerase
LVVPEANAIGVLGAASMVGSHLLPLLAKAGGHITAFSRTPEFARQQPVAAGASVAWEGLGKTANAGVVAGSGASHPISGWFCLAPVWVLPEYFDLLEAHGAKRVVVLSSTSIFAKQDSDDRQDQATARRLVHAEEQFRTWARSHGVQWVILRPTLIYGGGQDRNISEIARIIRRFGFFPVLGRATGKRQPIHAADVASACVAAWQQPAAANQAYNISGGETLPYCKMVTRVFEALGRRPRLLRVPLWTFRLAVVLLRTLPRYRQWSAAMAQRMGRDLVFDHADAARDLGFKPRPFLLTADDLPA